MSDVGANGKKRSRLCHLAVQPSRGPCLRTGPSPLDPRRCLPTSIPVQTLSVDVVTILLPPSLPLGLGHCAHYRTNCSNSEPHTQSLVVAGSVPQRAHGFLGNVVFLVEPSHWFNTTPRMQRRLRSTLCRLCPALVVTSSGGGIRRPDFFVLPVPVVVGMAAPRPVSSEAPFNPSQAPVIEGFSPTVYSNPEGFKEKFIRKTRENPMVPIGKWVL